MSSILYERDVGKGLAMMSSVLNGVNRVLCCHYERGRQMDQCSLCHDRDWVRVQTERKDQS